MNYMNVLITGATGMLGSYLSFFLSKYFNIYSTSSSELGYKNFEKFFKFDLNNQNYDKLVEWSQPEIIIHCGAITDLNYCEKNIDKTIEINSNSVYKFLKTGTSAKIIFISSDAVFSQNSHMKNESLPIEGLNVYGKSKVLGEKYLLNSLQKHLVLRTTLIGKNMLVKKNSFVEWVYYSITEKKDVALFDNVYFTPITIWHFAEEIKFLIEKNAVGLFHLIGSKKISKYDFGVLLCKKLKLSLNFIKRKKYVSGMFVAERLLDQSLSPDKYQKIFNRKLPDIDQNIDYLLKNFK